MLSSTDNSSFGHSFYISTDNNTSTPVNKLIQSPQKKRRRSDDLHSSRLIAEDNTPTEKKTKYLFKNKNQNKDSVDQKIFKISPFDTSFASDDFIDKFDGGFKEQAKLITSSAPFLNFTKDEQVHIRSLIFEISESAFLDNEAKCAELGIIYFYIASKKLSINSNFVQFRANELITEAKNLKNRHKNKCPENLQSQFPSGCRVYLLLAFVRMIFLADGAFNPGGCKALKMMMQGPLQLLITEEERLQIIRIADRLLTDQNFVLLFKEPFEIHEDMKKLISIDLQLLKDEPVNFIYLRWDLLMALISPFGQIDNNCFTIATAANTLVNSPDTVIEIFTEILKTGKLEFDKKQIPVSILLEGAMILETEFLNTISLNDIYDLTPFFMLRDCLNIADDKRISTRSKTCNSAQLMSLNSSLELQYKDDKDYAKLFYLSYKQNLLQKLLIAVIQYAAINTIADPKIEILSKDDTSSKEDLLNNIMKHLDLFFYEEAGANADGNADLENYLVKIKNALSESLYFVDYKNLNMEIDNGIVSFDFHENGLLCIDDPDEYDCFMQQRRLFIFENENLIPIDSISKFKESLWKIINNVEKQTRTRNYDFGKERMAFFMKSEDFEKVVSKIIYTLNDGKTLLEPDVYQDSDSFIIAQNGSGPNFLELWKPLNSRLSPVKLSAKNITSFFFQLCKLFSNFTGFAEKNSWVLVEDSTHLYNFYPFRYKEYWDGKTITKFQRKILESTTVDRVEQNLSFTIEKKERILTEVVGKASLKSHFTQFVDSSFDSRKFASEVKKMLPDELHAKLDIAINRIMNEISINDIEANLIAILSYAGEEAASEPYYKEVLARIKSLAEVYPYFTPYQLAKVIHKVLILADNPVVISRDGLEKQIRKLASMPDVIDIGNLNWTAGLQEKPSYTYLSIKYDFVYGLIFCNRKKGNEFRLDAKSTKDILNYTVMYLPR